MRPLYESRLFSTYTAAQITIVVTLSLARVRHRHLAAAPHGLRLRPVRPRAACSGALHTTNYVIETLPEWAWLPWRVMRYAATGGFVVAMTLFMLRFAGIRRARLHARRSAPTG